MRRLAVVSTAAAAIAAIHLVHAQGPVFRAGTDVVQLDVSVLDRDRQPVRGLTASDFTIVENGVEQPIVAFAAVDLPDVVRTRAPWTRDVAPDVTTNQLDAQRVVLILFDDCHTPWNPSVLLFSRRIARTVVDALGPRDLAGVVYTSIRRSGQELTTDRSRLLAAVERFIPQSPGPTGVSSAGADVPSFGLEMPGVRVDRYTRTAICMGGPEGSPLEQALRNAAEILTGWPGARKTLILVSTVAPDFSAMTLDDNLVVDNLGRTFAAMQRANLNIYQFDPRGLEVGRRPSENFGILSENTGGRAFTNTNTPWEGVPQVFRENSSYYLLGFRPTNEKRDGRFRKISVRVSRPDVEVRTRAGYYAPEPERPPGRSTRAAPAPIDSALSGGLPAPDLPLALTVAAVPVPNRKEAAVAVVTGIAGGDGVPAVARVEMTAMAFTDTWKTADTATQTVEITRRGPDGSAVTADVPLRFDLEPGRYEVRVAAHDPATGRTGSVFTSLSVPEFSKAALALSAVQFDRGTGTSDAARQAGVAPWPEHVTTARVFQQNASVSAVVQIAQIEADRPAGVTLTATVIDRDGAEVTRATREIPAEVFAPTRIVDHREPLPLETLAPGEYLLSLEAATGEESASSVVRFRVEGP